MFRLPTHLETLVPPPREQLPQSQPWRGSFFLPAASPHPAARPSEIRVTAAETENDNQQERWPRHFQLQVLGHRGILRDVQAWLAQIPLGQLPRCMIMPDRLSDQVVSRENQAQFEALARHLLEQEIVAVAPWSADPSSAGGILLYPTSTTSTLLVGIVFLAAGFPDFLQVPGAMGPGPSRAIHTVNLLPRLQPFQPVMHHTPFDPAPPHISSASRYSASGLDPTRGRSGRSSG